MNENDIKNDEMKDLSSEGQKPQPDAVLTQSDEIKGIDSPEKAGTIQEMRNPDGTYKKGVSGNPDGKPVGTKNWDTYFIQGLKYLADLNGKEPEEFDIELISKYLERGRKGDVRVLMNLFDRRFGKPKESIDHTTGGEKLNQKMEWVIVRGRKDEEHS
jgi:hypothetical protein